MGEATCLLELLSIHSRLEGMSPEVGLRLRLSILSLVIPHCEHCKGKRR